MRIRETGRKGGGGSGGNAGSEPPLPPISRAMQRVLDALLEGIPPPPEAQDALTDAERDEISALARTSHLTRLSLTRPEPDATGQTAALARAQQILAGRAASGALHPADSAEETSSPFWRAWWERLTKNEPRGHDGGENT